MPVTTRALRAHSAAAGALLAAAAAAPALAALPEQAPSPPSAAASRTAGRTSARTRPPARRRAHAARAARSATRAAPRMVPVGPTYRGAASWYGPGFHGRTTANGERYDMHGLTAAHRTLRFGTRLRVCLDGRCVVVRVNDRGPYVGDRILDLSRGAAERIGLIGSGVAEVSATVVAVEGRPTR